LETAVVPTIFAKTLQKIHIKTKRRKPGSSLIQGNS